MRVIKTFCFPCSNLVHLLINHLFRSIGAAVGAFRLRIFQVVTTCSFIYAEFTVATTKHTAQINLCVITHTDVELDASIEVVHVKTSADLNVDHIATKLPKWFARSSSKVSITVNLKLSSMCFHSVFLQILEFGELRADEAIESRNIQPITEASKSEPIEPEKSKSVGVNSAHAEPKKVELVTVKEEPIEIIELSDDEEPPNTVLEDPLANNVVLTQTDPNFMDNLGM